MIRWLDAIWGIASVEAAVGGSTGPVSPARSVPLRISRRASELIGQRLAGGAVRCLARLGWRSEVFLRDGTRVSGRLWERHTPDQLGLTFSEASLQLLDWLASWPWQAGVSSPLSRNRLSIGDRFFHFVAFEALHHTAPGTETDVPTGFPDRRADSAGIPGCDDLPPARLPAPIFEPGCNPRPHGFSKSLQPRLAARWESNERALRQITDPQVLAARSDTWSRRIDSFLNAIEASGRLDLARFLLVAMQRQIRQFPRMEDSSRQFERSTRERMQPAVRESIAARFRPLQRLKEWEQRADHRILR